jgi:predicted metalloendopeptidase
MEYEIRNKRKLIVSDTTLLEVEVEVYENRREEVKKTKEEANDPKWKRFLKRLDKLPDDVLRIIQSYFTFETRTALVENKFQSLKIFGALKKPMLHHLLYRIYRKFCLRNKNINLKAEAVDLWENVFGIRSISETEGHLWVSSKDLKRMVEYLVILFKSYEQHQYCFELFSIISLLAKKK